MTSNYPSIQNEKYLLLLFLFFINYTISLAQQYPVYTKADSIRGSLNEMRSSYDVKYYHLDITVDPNEKSINGSNTIYYDVLKDFKTLQVDLFDNLLIDSIKHGAQNLEFSREHHAVFIDFGKSQGQGKSDSLTIYYHGKPKVAVKPPWDGGFVWEKDNNGNDWIAVACEGIGASIWWPNKDHLSDEPDSMMISCSVPSELMCVSNGQLRNKTVGDNGFTCYDWFVSYPINNYNVTINIAKYAHINDTYTSRDGQGLQLDYYVLEYNKDTAGNHFQQVKPMLACFEEHFGKYPFWDDGYALVETPYWGMEHQSAVAYGNEYKNNEFGFDFIIIHESGHEYWGNSVSVNDHGEMWVHESFTTYAEALYLECRDNYKTAIQYLMAQKPKIKNVVPVLGPLEVNYDDWPDADIYYKGSWMLHSIRNTLDNDSLWLNTLKSSYQQFKLSNVNSEDIISYMVEKTRYDLRPIFEQYLTQYDPPVLIFDINKKGGDVELTYRWQADVKGFNMPMKLKFGDEDYQTIYPITAWKKKLFKNKKAADLKFADELFYFEKERVE